jgi:acid stress-induced BolA-like protein IbaG/YrbA
MEIAEVRDLIQNGIPGSEVIVAGEGCSFSVVVVGDAFEGLNPVMRQKKVLTTVQEPLASGALHAISMKVYTPTEWAKTPESQSS